MSGARKGGKVNHERWLVSYADFITLLFAFFVVLYSVAKSEDRKPSDVSAAISSAFQSLGVLPQFYMRKGVGVSNDVYLPPHFVPAQTRVLSAAGVRDDLENVRTHLQHALGAQIAAHIVSLHIGPDGLVISLHEAGFFKSGSAVPLPQSVPVLRTIGASLQQTPYDVRVEGHTDNVPIHTAQFASNWELSAARATSIARLLLFLHCVPPDRLSAAGYSEYHPVASNATAAGRAENRRVDLVVYPRVELNPASRASLRETGTWRTILDGDDKRN